jgi:hypothetical protein
MADASGFDHFFGEPVPAPAPQQQQQQQERRMPSMGSPSMQEEEEAAMMDGACVGWVGSW